MLCWKFLPGIAFPLDACKQVSHLRLFGLQISARDFRDAWLARNTFDNVNAGGFELAHFFRIVGQQPDPRGAKLLQNLSREIIVADVRRES